jgi:hypothetical protein
MNVPEDQIPQRVEVPATQAEPIKPKTLREEMDMLENQLEKIQEKIEELYEKVSIIENQINLILNPPHHYSY